VSAQHGIVALTGQVKTYSEKVAAERSALSVRGMRAVANDLHVRLVEERTDADLAADAAHALEFRATVPLTVHATVDDAYITLMGSVPWPYQRMDAEKAVRHIRGVKGVINHIEVIPGHERRQCPRAHRRGPTAQRRRRCW
jgi:osmotically-inducible protein OsmY